MNSPLDTLEAPLRAQVLLDVARALQEDLGATAVALAPALLAQLDALINERSVSGGRYNAQSQSEVDTEQF